jgi:hypothetical protein
VNRSGPLECLNVQGVDAVQRAGPPQDSEPPLVTRGEQIDARQPLTPCDERRFLRILYAAERKRGRSYTFGGASARSDAELVSRGLVSRKAGTLVLRCTNVANQV